MIHSLEKQLTSLLKKVLPDGVDLEAGPAFPPHYTTRRQVSVAISGLNIDNSDHRFGAETDRQFDTVSFISTHALPVVGNQQNFTLPDNVLGEISEVECPAGYLLKRGDDYQIEGRVLRFNAVPQHDLLVSLRGEKCRGYQERTACDLLLSIDVWAKQAGMVDEMVHLSISEILRYFADINVVKFSSDSGVFYRVLDPVIKLMSVDRKVDKVGNTRFIHSVAHLSIVGCFELNVFVGDLERQNIMQRFEYSTRVSDSE